MDGWSGALHPLFFHWKGWSGQPGTTDNEAKCTCGTGWNMLSNIGPVKDSNPGPLVGTSVPSFWKTIWCWLRCCGKVKCKWFYSGYDENDGSGLLHDVCGTKKPCSHSNIISCAMSAQRVSATPTKVPWCNLAFRLGVVQDSWLWNWLIKTLF
jgi:hypothetical protein